MGAGYETLPATQMLATHCAICGRPLLDAKSVQCAVGPDCRVKYGMDVEVPEEARAEANALIHRIALAQQHPHLVPNLGEACERLAKLGFPKVGARIAERFCDVLIQKDADGRLVVRSPYSDEMVQEFRQIPGRVCRLQEGCKRAKENVFPYAAKGQLWSALRRLYPLRKALLPDGTVMVIPRVEATPAESGFGDVGY